MSAPSDTVFSTRPFYWSVRRELWENKSIYMAPLIAAGVVLFGLLLSHLHPAHFTVHSSGRRPPNFPAETPYDIAAIVIIMTGLVVGLFYCLGALHNERRDRSILFWKSLPVSDLTTVLSKAAVPFLVIPVVTFVVAIATQIVMLAMNSVFLAATGKDVGGHWAQLDLFPGSLVLIYGLVAVALWQAPFWGWLLMVSAWAKRTAFLWAFGPPLALCVVERIAFNTGYLAKLFGERVSGGLEYAFTPHHKNQIKLEDVDPAKFVANPGLWVGLVVAVVFLGVAIWLRRRREPI